MKTTVETLDAAAVERGWLGIVLELIKAQLTTLVLITTAVGFYLGSPGSVDYSLLLNTLLGTGLLAAGASALNQFLEREYDGRMQRTEGRPLPSGQLHPDVALIFGGVTALQGLAQLAWAVNPLTGFIGAVTLGLYVFGRQKSPTSRQISSQFAGPYLNLRW